MLVNTIFLIVISYAVLFVIWSFINTRVLLKLRYLYLTYMLTLLFISLYNAYFSLPIEINNLAINWMLCILLFAGVVFLFSPVRKILLSSRLFLTMKKTLSPISETEMIALKAGDVWWDKELFSGNPNWKILDTATKVDLTAEEKDFLEHKVSAVCEMIDPYLVRQNQDLPPEAWEFLKKNKFFGMIIPKEYGGLNFSHTAHSLIVAKLASHSSALGITAMVPNSLGPGELLIKYGTNEQKEKYLQRLATGEEIPCFSLTSTYAGSDAGNIIDNGIICEQEFEGKKIIGILLNWEKRYITLGPVATLIGLAFKAYDPNNLLPKNHKLSGKVALGITCALIPRDTKGMKVGNRHNPLGIGFMNGPNSGKDVFIPMDYVIGGSDMLGQGWRMLMECLSIGRGISLPSTGSAGCQKSLYLTSLYANTREQFGLPISKFEGIAEKIGKMIIDTYRTKANCIQTTKALDSGIVPSTISAIIKYRNTECARNNINYAMDISAGRGVIAGPKNYLLDGYLGAPVGITVEGANILTRGLMVFGQGVTRCHPYLFDEINALYHKQPAVGLTMFNKVLFNHLGYTTHNILKLQGMRIGIKPAVKYGLRDTKVFYKKLLYASIKFATLADLSLLFIGGELKRKEMLSGQFADALSCLYEITSALQYYDSLSSKDDKMKLVMSASVNSLLYECDMALLHITRNLPINSIIKNSIKWLLNIKPKPLTDNLLLKLSQLTTDVNWIREKLANDVYISKKPNDPCRELIDGHSASLEQRKIRNMLNAKGIKYQSFESFESFIEALVKDNHITDSQAQDWLLNRKKIFAAISVDEFEFDEISKIKI